jgi:hypothetical protein
VPRCDARCAAERGSIRMVDRYATSVQRHERFDAEARRRPSPNPRRHGRGGRFAGDVLRGAWAGRRRWRRSPNGGLRNPANAGPKRGRASPPRLSPGLVPSKLRRRLMSPWLHQPPPKRWQPTAFGQHRRGRRRTAKRQGKRLGFERKHKRNRGSGRRDSNPRQPAWEAGTLPLSYTRTLLFYPGRRRKQARVRVWGCVSSLRPGAWRGRRLPCPRRKGAGCPSGRAGRCGNPAI